MPSITFSGEAHDAFVRLASQIPDDYTVALLEENQEVPDADVDLEVDVCFVSADDYGVRYHRLHTEDGRYGEADRTATFRRPWSEIDRIHIY